MMRMPSSGLLMVVSSVVVTATWFFHRPLPLPSPAARSRGGQAPPSCASPQRKGEPDRPSPAQRERGGGEGVHVRSDLTYLYMVCALVPGAYSRGSHQMLITALRPEAGTCSRARFRGGAVCAGSRTSSP